MKEKLKGAHPKSSALWFLAAATAAISFAVMSGASLHGDEYTYVAHAKILGHKLSGHMISESQVLDALIGNGWFMPGIKFWGAILFAITPNASNALLRAWVGILNFLLFLVVLREAHSAFGRQFKLAMLIFPSCALLWDVAALSFLPDIPGALLATYGIIRGYRIALDQHTFGTLSWHRLASFELAMTCAVYFRGPLVLMAVTANLCLFVLCILARRYRHGVCISLSFLGGSAMLLPWSLAVSQNFSMPVLTTTNFPLVIANSFGESSKTCFGPCTLPGQDIEPSWKFAQELSSRTGENSLLIERRMMAASLEGITVGQYLKKVRANMIRFLLEPEGWFVDLGENLYGVPVRWRSLIIQLFRFQTLILYTPSLFGLFLANIVVLRKRIDLQLLSIVIKVATFCFLMQPFFHKSSARYWGQLAPISALSVVLLWCAFTEMCHPSPKEKYSLGNTISFLQAVYSILFCVLATLILLA